MKTVLDRLTNDQAEKEMKYVPIIAATLTILPLFIFGFVAIVGLAVSGRGLLLTFHTGVIKKNILLWRIFFVFCSAVALVEIVLIFVKK